MMIFEFVCLHPHKHSVKCVFCMEQCPVASTLSAPCSHYICRSCVTRNVEVCTRDETTYPPKCCGNKLPSRDLINLLKDLSLRARYEIKCIEYSTPIRDRIYCCKCTDFLGQKRTDASSSSLSSSTFKSASSSTSTRSVAHEALCCYRCLISTCMACRQAAHPSRRCLETPEDLAFKRLSAKKRWRKCPNCEAVVERRAGCSHIRCRCGTDFCYLCGKKLECCSCRRR